MCCLPQDAVYGLCAFGIGKKATQAEALFNVMDASGDGSVTRAELLAFMTVMLPDGLVLPKIESFKRVSEIFQVLDADGGGELEATEFVRGVCDNKVTVHTHSSRTCCLCWFTCLCGLRDRRVVSAAGMLTRWLCGVAGSV